MNDQTTWSEIVPLALGLGQFWAKNLILGCVAVSLSFRPFGEVVNRVSCWKRQAESWEEWPRIRFQRLTVAKCRRLAWLRSKEVEWWDAKHNRFRTRLIEVMPWGLLQYERVVEWRFG